MSLAENLLNSLVENDYQKSRIAGIAPQEEHIIVGQDRVITVPNSLKTIAVTGDKNVETVTFDCARYWDGNDLTNFSIYLNYTLPDGKDGTHTPTDIQTFNDHYSFTWTIDNTVTRNEGNIKISVMARLVDDRGTLIKQWSSFVNSELTIVKGLNISYFQGDDNEEQDKEYQDFLSNLLVEINNKVSKNSIVQNTGYDKEKVMSQEAVTIQLSSIETCLEKLEKDVENLSYKPIAITSFSCTPSVAELGSTVNSVTLNWTLNKAAKTAKLLGGPILSTGESGSYTVSGPISTPTTWTVFVTGEKGDSASKDASLTFLNRIYYGAASSFSTNLSSELASSKTKKFTANAGNGEYIWYAVPSRLGTCYFNVGGFDGGFSLDTTISLTNSSGYSELYYIYRSDNMNLGNTTVSVS